MELKKVLVLRLGAVGDVIRTLPAVKVLKERFPSFSITWMVEEPSFSLLTSQPEVDQVILFPRRRWTRGMKSIIKIWGTLGEMGKFVKRLRQQEFDTALDFHGILKSGILSFLSGADRRIGYDRKSSKEWNFLFSNIQVELPGKKISRFQRNLALLKGIGIEAKTFQGSLHIPSGDRDYVQSFIQSSADSLRRPLIAIHSGTSAKAVFKRWPADSYARLADRCIRELGATVLFTWGADEREWVEGIRKRMKETALLAPRTDSLTQLGELFRQCDLYIGGDTGPMHIASLMGVPVVVLYGPTDPVENEPFGRHIQIRKETDCSPCHRYSCKDPVCMKAISPEDVFQAVKEMLLPAPRV